MNQHAPLTPADYATDFYAWTQRQADLLRGLMVSNTVVTAGLDVANLAEEIEGLGSSDLSAVKSYIRQIFVHLIKAAADPQSQAALHWRSEPATFHADMLDRFSPSMRQLIDIQKLWLQALKLARLNLLAHDIFLPADLPERCPIAIEELIAEEFDFGSCVNQLHVGFQEAR